MQDGSVPPHAEKRRFKRYRLDTQVGILDKGAFSFETSVEIGEGGMLLKTFRPLVVGQRIEVRFFLPNGIFLAATGEVVYTLEPNIREYFAGIRFIDLPEELASAVRSYCETADPH